MKQPELGRKILELRKAKGMTQEELVERCNINVRTIQRIESGDVLPRSYTIRTILEALDTDFSTLQLSEETTEHQKQKLGEMNKLLLVSFFVGLVYLLLTFVESFIDLTYMVTHHTEFVSGRLYTLIKVAVMVTFGIFHFGFYKLATIYTNSLLQGATILLLMGILLSTAGDLYVYWWDDELLASVQLAKAVLFGGLYVVFGAGLLKYKTQFGALATISSVIGIFTGVCLLTIILAIPALISLTVFEITLLVMLYQAAEGPANVKNQPQEASLQLGL